MNSNNSRKNFSPHPTPIIPFWNPVGDVLVGCRLGKTCLLASNSKNALSKTCLEPVLWDVGSTVFRKKSQYLGTALSEIKSLTNKLGGHVVTAVVGSMQNNLFRWKPQVHKGVENAWEPCLCPGTFPLRILSCWTKGHRAWPCVCCRGNRGASQLWDLRKLANGLFKNVGHSSSAPRLHFYKRRQVYRKANY